MDKYLCDTTNAELTNELLLTLCIRKIGVNIRSRWDTVKICASGVLSLVKKKVKIYKFLFLF